MCQAAYKKEIKRNRNKMKTETKEEMSRVPTARLKFPPVFPKLSRSSNIRSTISTNEKQKSTVDRVIDFIL